MSGRRPANHTQFEVWVTREASEALNAAALNTDRTRGEYLQAAIWSALVAADLTHPDDRDILLPPPRQTANRYRVYTEHRSGYKGRWSLWVKARCTVHNRVPMMLTRAAYQRGFGSASALVRHHLAIAIKDDTGKTVTMPKGRTPANLFGGHINEVVL